MTINWTDSNNLLVIDDTVEPKLHRWLKGMLAVTEATITFTKVDGTERVMKCTLESSKLPVVELKEDAKPRKETTSTKALRVFDLEKKEWRAFTIKNIKRIEISLGERNDSV
jgi:hypothetical protein